MPGRTATDTFKERMEKDEQMRGENVTVMPPTRPQDMVAWQGEWALRGMSRHTHALVTDAALAEDPIVRLLMRYDEMESGNGVTAADAMNVKLDRAEAKLMRGTGAVSQTNAAAQVVMALHAAWHFTHGAATDGSRAGESGDDHEDEHEE